MFCDLVGSTALSARLDPEDMREVIGRYHRCCTEQITKAGGFVAKYLGDGVLAYFGYPQAHEDDAERAIRASLALIKAVPKVHAQHDAALQVRVGAATGLVVVGDLVGEGVALEHGVVGDTPNLAARLQTLAEPGQVVISNTTRRLTGGMFDYRDMGKVTLKGLVDPVQAWQVLGASAVESRFEAQHGAALTPLVGREEELELLLRRWRQAASGEGCVALISGEPGIGKSRLTVALSERLQDEPHTRVRSFCSPHHTDSALHPSITQLERAAGFARDDMPQAKLDKMTSLLGPSSGHESDTQLLAELLSIPTTDRYAPLNWSPQRKKEKTFEALLRQLEMLSRQRPVLVIYEDAHWIDPSSRELLDMTVDRVRSLPVLLIITFRPEFQPPWTGQAHVSTLALSGLGRREGAALVESVAGERRLSEEITAEIVERTDGVPLFVEEVTKAVLAADAHDECGKRPASISPLSSSSVPATLEALLMTRLDRLGRAAKEVAQVGATIGREFSYELLAPVARKDDDELGLALKHLGEVGLVSCRGAPPHASFLFKHALVRDAAYATLLRARRQQIHENIVSVAEAEFPEIVTGQPELMARHCVGAGLIDRAVSYWLKAGQKSAERSAMVEAVTLLQNGLDLLDGISDTTRRQQHELDIQTALGPALIATQGYGAPRVSGTYARARQLCEQMGQPQYLVGTLYGQIGIHLILGKLEKAVELADDLFRLGEARSDMAVKSLAGCYRGLACFWLGDFVQARACLEQWLHTYNVADRPFYNALTAEDPHCVGLIYLARTLLYLGYPDQARVRRDEAITGARGHAHTLVNCLAHSLPIESSPEVMLRAIGEIMDLSGERGFPMFRAAAYQAHGAYLAAMGRPEEGIAEITKGLAEYRVTGAVLIVPSMLCSLASALARARRPREGLKRLEEAGALIDATHERMGEAEMHRRRGGLLASIGEPVGAEDGFRQALTVAQRQNGKFWELRTSIRLARLWRDQGKRTEARDLLAPIYGWFTEGFDTRDLKEAKALLEELG